ncbi:MAG: hypothetical protein IPG09_11290 [Ignavibacteria bacterium]|nr:hypothetical protein [Ignavibacteria bacterium]
MIIKENILLSDHTTIKLGGAAKYFIECDTEESVKEALEFAKKRIAKYRRYREEVILFSLITDLTV